MNSILSDVLKKSILIRETEETLLNLFAQGRLNGTVHTCIGQEYVGALISTVLIEGDAVFSNHRCHGHYIGKTNDVEGLLLEVLGSSQGVVSGVGGSQHLYHEDGFYSNGILAGMAPVAAGYARTLVGSENIVCLFIGDGAIGEGIFYEALNLISKFSLPIIIINENNNYSQSTSREQTFFGDMKMRVQGFGINYQKVDIWDLENLINEVSLAFDDIRLNKKPIFIEVECYRLMAHSKGDDDRSTKEINRYLKIDPINVFKNTNNELFLKYLDEAKARIKSFLEKNPSVENIPNETDEIILDNNTWNQFKYHTNKRVNELIYESIKENMEINDNIFFFGEDIEFPYGGAFKVSKDLSKKFKNRVCNMPDSEQSIVGFGNGLSLGKKLPICEIMFGDFMGLVFDQWLNHAAKFQKMYGNKFDMPIIVRTPMGGKRGYGPTHSQNLEKHFLGIPNTQVIAINPRHAPKEIYNKLFQTITKPTLVIENKLDYTRKDVPLKSKSHYVYSKNNLQIYDLKYSIINENPDITIVCWGGLVCELEEVINDLTEKEEIIIEMIVPTSLYPLNLNSIKDSVIKTNKILIIEDETPFGTLGSEIISQLSQANFNFRSIIMNTENDIIPSSKILEDHHYVTNQKIYNEVKRFFLL